MIDTQVMPASCVLIGTQAFNISIFQALEFTGGTESGGSQPLLVLSFGATSCWLIEDAIQTVSNG